MKDVKWITSNNSEYKYDDIIFVNTSANECSAQSTNKQATHKDSR